MSIDESKLAPLPKTRRSVKNYALQPGLQIKLGLYSVVLAIFFAIAVGLILYFNLAKLMAIVLELTGVEEEVNDLMNQYIAPAKIQLLLAMGVYVFATVILSIKYTHKLVGPTIAFRRHIRMIADQQWDYRTKLRDGDAFSEVAEDLNRLSSYLKKKYGDQTQ